VFAELAGDAIRVGYQRCWTILGFSLQLIGYRAFEDSGAFELFPGRTASIGMNNAGKPSILRSLYETRNMFSALVSGDRSAGAGAND